MNRVYTLCLIVLSFISTTGFAQQSTTHSFTLNWVEGTRPQFDGAGEFSQDPRLPVYSYRFALPGKVKLDAMIRATATAPFNVNGVSPEYVIPRDYYIGATTEQERGKWYGRVWLMPIRGTKGQYEKILSGEIIITTAPVQVITTRSGPNFKDNSVLASGNIHRISVDQSGVYKIDYNYIKDKLKTDPATVDVNRIGVYGNGAGRIPQWNNAPRIDDLEQVATHSEGLQDGRFDPGDFLMFYAEGPDQWTYSAQEKIYHMDKNIYDVINSYYIILNGPTRNAMSHRDNAANGSYTSSSSLVYQRLEDEKVNLLGRFRAPGSGQEWYGDEFSVQNSKDYTDRFDLSGILPDDTMYYKVRFAARSGSLSTFYIGFNQKEFSRNVGSVVLDYYEASFANDAVVQGQFKTTEVINKIQLRYPSANGINTRGWLDYIELNFWRNNQYKSGQALQIRDPRASYLGIPTYSATNVPAQAMVWDVTHPFHPVHQAYTGTNNITFSSGVTGGDVPNEFIIFNPSSDVKEPVYVSPVANQNLHQINRADMVILYYDDFESAATTLANHRRSHSQLEVVTVPVSQVFHEFGGGSKDPAAIRDFARMIYSRDPQFKYLLLMGDATYDYLNRSPELPYHNFIPAFESEESLDPIRSFPSDDFYALLDDDEGNTLKGALDIAIGRFPVSTNEEALSLVNKIIYYDKNPATLGDWRQRVVMVADDQDENTHLNQTEKLAVNKASKYPDLNIEKIYLDAYPQESTPGGDRYPAVAADLDLNVNKGALTVTYIGHGGQNGWTQERILGINQAQSYNNLNNMPLFITATCSFAGYDEPSFTTAGEHLLINPDGGAIGLMTTVRAVYSGSNERLTENVLKIVYESDQPGKLPGIAEILRRSKNVGIDSIDINARKFTLLGDPSLVLSIPRYHIELTEINGKNAGEADTLSALEKSTISGVVTDDNGEVLTSFNGKISLTVFDKVQVRKTLANDEDSFVRNFVTQDRQLFKGAATVSSGTWTIEFVLPKDIDFNYGNGKMSFYAENGVTDAAGYYSAFTIGGVSPDGLTDDKPPVIQLYMNDDNFVSGGITSANPEIYAVLSDDFGINVSGTGIGHDVEAILDNDDKNSFILNDFYEASLDDFTRGEVRFPLKGLAAGKHTLKLTAWDLANNPGEAYIEFLVLDDDGPVLTHVLNYPNPFTTSTNFQFEHNRPGVEMNLQVLIYTINGRLVKTIDRQGYISDGFRVDDLPWDGLDDSGGQLAKGVYVYKIKAAFKVNGGTEIVNSDAEKLVILR